MMLPPAPLALLAIVAVAAVSAVQAQPTTAKPPSASTGGPDSASHEATDVDASSSAEEENVTVQGKAAPLCPPRPPELLAIEAECAAIPECTSTAAPSTDATEAAATVTAATATVSSTEAAPPTVPTPSAVPGATPATTAATATGRRQRKRTCNYHLCVLKNLEVLDTSDMPDKILLTNWIANFTDEKQKEQTQQRFTDCVSMLKDIFGETSENSKSTEEDSTDDKKNEESQPKKKSCVAAKKVVSCLSKLVECPVLKF